MVKRALPGAGVMGAASRLAFCYFARDMISEGDKAPDFDLETDDGRRVSLSSLRGRNAVLFFYPKDNTSG
jgi:hypothetical protein